MKDGESGSSSDIIDDSILNAPSPPPPSPPPPPIGDDVTDSKKRVRDDEDDEDDEESDTNSFVSEIIIASSSSSSDITESSVPSKKIRISNNQEEEKSKEQEQKEKECKQIKSVVKTIAMEKKVVSSSSTSSTSQNAKNTAVAVWDGSDARVSVVSIRGNFWKTMGHTDSASKRGNVMYVEEALFLVEKKQLLVELQTSRLAHTDSGSALSHCTNTRIAVDREEEEEEGTQYLSLRQFYESVVRVISLECYLTYVKLKSLDYVVQRRGSELRCCKGEEDVIASFRQHLVEHRGGVGRRVVSSKKERSECASTEEPSLLDFMTSFDIFLVGDNFTKRNAVAGVAKPVAHVIVTSCQKLYSSRLTLTLLKQSGRTPCIFAIVMPHSGFVMLEEMTDAELTLSWDFGTMNKSSGVGSEGSGVETEEGKDMKRLVVADQMDIVKTMIESEINSIDQSEVKKDEIFDDDDGGGSDCDEGVCSDDGDDNEVVEE